MSSEDENLSYFRLTNKEMVLAITADNELYRMLYGPFPDNYGKTTETAVSKDRLPGELRQFFSGVDPDKWIVYVKADSNAVFSNIVDLFDLLRTGGIDRVGVVAADEDVATKRNAAGFEVKLPAPPVSGDMNVKPNPLTLVATVHADGSLALNGERRGTIANMESLENILRQVFREREQNGVFREGTNEIEKTVWIRMSRTRRYEEFLRTVHALKRMGAGPIRVQVDDLENVK